LAMGMQVVTFLSRGAAHAVAERLRYADAIVTTFEGGGRDGPVAVCMAVVQRKKAPALIRMAAEIDPSVLVTVEDVRHSTARQPRPMPAGYL